MAPELYGYTKKGSPYAVDIWAVGEIAFQMLTKQPTFRHSGLLFVYVNKLETFPPDLLLDARVSQSGVEFILSAMRPIPDDRITTEKALHHKWMDHSLPHHRASATPVYKKTSIASAIDSMTEEYASWDTTVMSPEAPTVIPRKSQEFKTTPLQTSSDETIGFPPAQSTTRRFLDGKLVTRSILKHSSPVHAMTFSPDGKLVATADYDCTVTLWDPATGAAHKVLKGHSSFVNAVAFSPDGKLLASASRDKTVMLWDPATGARRNVLKGHSHWVNAVAFSPDGKLLASASHDKSVMLWDPATGAARNVLKGHSSYVSAVVFSPDGKLLASASDDKSVVLWDTATGTARNVLKGNPASFNFFHLLHSYHFSAVAFSPDGKLLASALWDRRVMLWDPATGMVRSTLKGHSDPVLAVAFSPDGKLVASGSYDKTVILWDPTTGVACSTLNGHSNRVPAVAFSPDGKLLASASLDETVRLWGHH